MATSWPQHTPQALYFAATMLPFITLVLASVVAARPQESAASLLSRETLNSMTVGQASDVCGGKQQIYCCNDSAAKQSENNSQDLLSGLLNGLLGNDGLQLTGQCAPLDVTIIGANSLLNHHCSGKVACCDGHKSDVKETLINAALPCVALGSLIG